MEGLTLKYTFIAFIQWTASLVSPEKSVGSAAFNSEVLVVVNIRFVGGRLGLTGGCSGGMVGRGGAVVRGAAEGRGLVVGITDDTVVTRGVTGGKGFITGTLGWDVEGGKEAMHLGGEDKNAGLIEY